MRSHHIRLVSLFVLLLAVFASLEGERAQARAVPLSGSRHEGGLAHSTTSISSHPFSDTWELYALDLAATIKDLGQRWLDAYKEFVKQKGASEFDPFGQMCASSIREALSQSNQQRFSPQDIVGLEHRRDQTLECWRWLLSVTRAPKKRSRPSPVTSPRKTVPVERDEAMRRALIEAERQFLLNWRRRALTTFKQWRHQIEACQRQSIDLTLRLFEQDRACQDINETRRDLKQKVEALMHQKEWMEVLMRQKEQTLRLCQKRTKACLNQIAREKHKFIEWRQTTSRFQKQVAERIAMLEGMVTLYKDRLKETIRSLHQESQERHKLQERLQSMEFLIEQRLKSLVQDESNNAAHLHQTQKMFSNLKIPQQFFAKPFSRFLATAVKQRWIHAMRQFHYFAPGSVL